MFANRQCAAGHKLALRLVKHVAFNPRGRKIPDDNTLSHQYRSNRDWSRYDRPNPDRVMRYMVILVGDGDMSKFINSTIFAAATIVATPLVAHGGGFGVGVVAGAVLGSAIVPQQPSVIVIQASPPQPTYEQWRYMNGLPPSEPIPLHQPETLTTVLPSPPPGKAYWCGTSASWYPQVQTCSTEWSLQYRRR